MPSRLFGESFVRVIGPRDPREKDAINCCFVSDTWSCALSPFYLGPVTLWDGRVAFTVENAWQYSKVYPEHVNRYGRPMDPEWYDWSWEGFRSRKAVRYPMGKGVKPVGLWWMGRMLSYVEARSKVYWSLYRDAVAEEPEFYHLQRIAQQKAEAGCSHITLWDFDGYDRGNASLYDVLNDSHRKMGHAFVLAAMLAYGTDVTPADLIPEALSV